MSYIHFFYRTTSILLLLFTLNASADSLVVINDSPFTKYLPIDQFNKLWKERCTDINERPLEVYLQNHAVKAAKLPPSIVVSAQKSNWIRQCYRGQFLDGYILEWKDGFPLVTSSKSNSNVPDKGSLNFSQLFDFISASARHQVKSYKVFLDTGSSSEKKSLYVLLYQYNGHWHGIEGYQLGRDEVVFGIYNISSFFMLEKHGSDLRRKNVYPSYGAVSDFRYEIDDDSISVNVSSLPKTDSKRLIPTAFNIRPEKTTISITMPAKFTDSTSGSVFLSKIVGEHINLLHGAPLQKRVPSSWLAGIGYLTLENGKKRKMPNSQRLEIWLRRYLTHYRINLEAGRTYYFNTDLGGYLLMDYYKENGEPIYPQSDTDICKRFKVNTFPTCQ